MDDFLINARNYKRTAAAMRDDNEVRGENGKIFTLEASEPTYTVGLLGARLTGDATCREITDARLEEIERRIMKIEAMVWPTGR